MNSKAVRPIILNFVPPDGLFYFYFSLFPPKLPYMPQHSPEFINEMQKRLQKEYEQLQRDLEAMATKSGGDYQANFPDYGRNEEDNATEIGDYAAAAATETTLETRLRNIEASLERIKTGTYGITDDGELIPEERLRANPAATTIIKPEDRPAK